MILVLKHGVREEEKDHVRSILREEGCIIREMTTGDDTIIGAVGQVSRDLRFFEQLPGVAKVVPLSRPYKLVSREMHPEDTVVQIGDVELGGPRIVVVAGPCAVESREQAMSIARKVKDAGAVLFRGGAFKPRTSPYSFQGLGEEGLKILAQVREETGLRVASEMTSPGQADVIIKYVDLVQIGARNMQNFELLRSAGRMGKPVLLKRGLSATMEEWLMSAEYVLSEGNDQVILCERGIRTFERYTRNTLDLSAIPIIKKLTHLPVVIDPSHATGIREKVSPMARAAIAAGADGLIIEVHHEPDKAFSDGPQSLYPEQFEQLMRDLYVIAPVVGKQLDFGYLEKATTDQPLPSVKTGGPKRAVFAGEMRAFAHKAASQFFGSEVKIEPVPSFRSVYQEVKNGNADFGVIPLENSLTGSVHENYDLLLDYEVRIIGELTLRIVHALIGHPGTQLEDVKRVISHPQAFEQCRDFLEQQQGWELVAARDTATAVRRIKEEGNPGEVAIAAKEAAALYGLDVLKEGIETNARNYTRFAVIAAGRITNGPRGKSSLVYSTSNTPGSLYDTLKIFAENGVNLVKLESRPIHGKPWEYMFYVDLEGDIEAPELQAVMEELSEKTEYLRILGTY
ncbi:MAG: 3-deoxy-7-phosphoheptulonate synthase [Deltaproteobacteria bacterium]|nr:MAG: 3-deoxy-7-phosphoheptulonate synthase [Deltaproteobacteria bacterium]